MTAAWAGSIALHAGLLLGLHWVALPLAPVPKGPSALEVAVIESVEVGPSGMQSGGATGSTEQRVVMRPPVRLVPLTAPVTPSRAPEITTVPASAVEVRPTARLRARSAVPTKERRPAAVAKRRVESVEREGVLRRRPTARQSLAQVRRGAGTIAATEGRNIQPVENSPTRDRGAARRRDAGVLSSPRLSTGGSVRTLAPPVPTTVPKSTRAARRPPVRTSPGKTPPIVQALPGTKEGRVLGQAAGHIQAAGPSTAGSSKLGGEEAGTRTMQIVGTQPDRRASRRAPKIASLRHHQSRIGTTGVVSDYGWLARAVHQRIAERKRYPHAARVNHWEGKVVLMAVIRDDGHLAALSVRTSSGHHELDEDAMELVRRICPLPLKHPLGRPDITMHIPITYTLDR